MEKSGIQYLDLYDDPANNPTAAMLESGLSGCWTAPNGAQETDAGIPASSASAPDAQTGAPDAGKQSSPRHAETSCNPRLINPGRAAVLMRFINSNDFSLEDKILADIGCGDGNLAMLLSLAGATVYAIDPSRDQLALLKAVYANPGNRPIAASYLKKISPGLFSRFPGLVLPYCSRIENLPLKDNSVDAVTLKFVLNWSENGKALKEVKRVLRPGGSVFIMTTTHPAGSPSLFNRAWNETVDDLQKENVTFKNLESPRNPAPIHHLPFLTGCMEKLGFTLAGQKIYEEKIPADPAIYVHYLQKTIGGKLRSCLEGSHSLTDAGRNRILVQKMRRISKDETLPCAAESTIAMLHFKKL